MRWYSLFFLPLLLVGLSVSGCDNACNEDSSDYPECLDDDEEAAARQVDGGIELRLV